MSPFVFIDQLMVLNLYEHIREFNLSLVKGDAAFSQAITVDMEHTLLPLGI